jgi:Trk K+ transport system NAD-binding subunit
VETDGWVPIILSFVMPIGMALILGEGVLRVFSIYIQKDRYREEWDIMVANTFSDHVVICGVGELGYAMAKRILKDHPHIHLVLMDQRSGLQAEANLGSAEVVYLQADMTSTASLRHANCDKARLVLLTTGNDAYNLEAAYKIINLNPNVEIWVRLHHAGLADLMDLARKPNVHFFSPYHQAADAIACQVLREDHKG